MLYYHCTDLKCDVNNYYFDLLLNMPTYILSNSLLFYGHFTTEFGSRLVSE